MLANAGVAGKEKTLSLQHRESQQRPLRMKGAVGAIFTGPSDFERSSSSWGCTGPSKLAPVLAHQFHVYCENEGAAIQAAQRLRTQTVDGRSANGRLAVRPEGVLRLPSYQKLPKSTQLLCGAGRTADSIRLFYQV
jgi:hypothetical protein